MDASQNPLRSVYINSMLLITIQLSCRLKWRLNAIRSTVTRVRAGHAAKGLEDTFAYFLEHLPSNCFIFFELESFQYDSIRSNIFVFKHLER